MQSSGRPLPDRPRRVLSIRSYSGTFVPLPRPRHGERFNFYTHLLALLLALAGAQWLLARAAGAVPWHGLLGLAVHAGALVLAFAASSALHGTADVPHRALQRLDHGAIYLLIAGTYTPFAVLAPAGAWSWALLLVLWGCAAAGIRRECTAAGADGPALPLYLAMGWMAVAGAAPLAAGVGTAACAWLLVGAAFYSGGTWFFRNRRGHRHAHGVWHLMVLAGAASHFASVALVLQAAAGLHAFKA